MASEEARASVLLGLRRSAGRGATLVQLGCRKVGDVRHRAIRALVGEGAVVVFGDGRNALAVVADRAPTEEALARKIDARASMKRGCALGREDVAAWCSAAEEFLLDAVLRSLVKSGRLIALRHGEATLYAHANSFVGGHRESVARPQEPEKPAGHDVHFRMVEAYRRLVERDGFSDVVIAELRREAGVPQEQLVTHLLEQSRCGRAHLGRGDWSLADEATRQAAVMVAGEPHLRVRLMV